MNNIFTSNKIIIKQIIFCQYLFWHFLKNSYKYLLFWLFRPSMTEILKRHILIFYFFLLCFCVTFLSTLPISFSHIILAIFLSLFLPFQSYLQDLKAKNILDKRILFLIILVIFWYIFSFENIDFIVFLVWIVCLYFEVNSRLFFTIWIILFLLFLCGSFFSFDTSILISVCFIIFILGIWLHLLEWFTQGKKLTEKNALFLSNILFYSFHICLLFSVFYESIRIYLGVIMCGYLIFNSFILASLPKILIQISDPWEKLKSHIFVFSSFIILFFPIFDMHITWENNRKILFLTFLSFMIMYIIGVKISNKIKK